MNLDKGLEGALHIEAVTRIEDNERRVSSIQSNENTQLVNSINDLVRILQTNQSNRQDNQKFSSQGARPKKFLRGSERSSRETGDRNRTIIAITEAALIIVDTIATVERNCQHQEAIAEAEIGRTRVAPSSQRQR